jgi:RNA polymerase sigma-70 factor (ECF subfamily)
MMLSQDFVHGVPGRNVTELRSRLLGLAYRMLGDYDEAEDVVQEAYLRWQRADRDAVHSPEAWLVTVTTRLAIDRQRRMEKERTSYPGTWLPEPIPTDRDQTELASDLSMALLVLLEQLRPEERAAFLLREVFDAEYEEIARILERSQDAVRQMVHRARVRVQTGRPRVKLAAAEHERLLDRFKAALERDDAAELLAILSPDVVLTSDGGGRVPAVRRPLIGAERVSKFLLGVARKFRQEFRLTQLNGEPALLAIQDGSVASAYNFAIDGAGIHSLLVVRNPEKLEHILALGEPLV